jgi:hypothetical protein
MVTFFCGDVIVVIVVNLTIERGTDKLIDPWFRAAKPTEVRVVQSDLVTSLASGIFRRSAVEPFEPVRGWLTITA